MPVDLRSDTVTRPTPAMLDAMMHAEVGDDVFGEDPSINQLEKMAAELFGMEAALYSPSGTMSNQIGIKCHTQPGDEVICERSSHVYIYEGGGIAFNSGSQVRALDGNLGRITAPADRARLSIPMTSTGPGPRWFRWRIPQTGAGAAAMIGTRSCASGSYARIDG